MTWRQRWLCLWVFLCVSGWEGWGCTDNSEAYSYSFQLLSTLLLCLSNLMFVPPVAIAIRSHYLLEASVYIFTMFFSTVSVWHANTLACSLICRKTCLKPVLTAVLFLLTYCFIWSDLVIVLELNTECPTRKLCYKTHLDMCPCWEINLSELAGGRIHIPATSYSSCSSTDLRFAAITQK